MHEVVGVDLHVEGVAPAVEVELLFAAVALVAADACELVEERVLDDDVLALGEELELELVALALHAGLVALVGVVVAGLVESGRGVGGVGSVEFGHAVVMLVLLPFGMICIVFMHVAFRIFGSSD